VRSPGLEPATIDAALHDVKLRDFRPRPALRVDEHLVPRARFAAIDGHNHLGRWLTDDGGWASPDVSELLDDLDACNMTAVVNLDGGWGHELEANLDRYDRAHPGRFATFCHLDWEELGTAGWPDRLASSLDASIDAGAKGLKVWKSQGLTLRDERGALVMPDDDRLASVWATAAERRVPITIHVADPVAFFEPVDARNERLEELLAHPEWSFADPRYPRFDRLIEALEHLVAANPATTFIGAHVGCFAEDLRWVDRMLTAYPNFHVDIAARIAELGRQPRSARRLILAHPDRVLFGMDLFPPDRADYAIHFRFLETDDECFAYATEEPPPEGRWSISGIHLPDDVLAAVYRLNAERLIPGLGPDREWP
jgi:hypothetical protein